MMRRKKLNFTIQYVLIFGALMLAANILLGVLLVNQTRQTLRQLLEKNMLDITNMFGATSVLIMVSVALEPTEQLESQMLMRHYKGFLN